MDDFVAIDFETANRLRSSVCSVGLVFVRNGQIVDERYSLIKPYPNYYLDDNIAIHHITPDDTRDAPTFDEVWEQFLKEAAQEHPQYLLDDVHDHQELLV